MDDTYTRIFDDIRAFPEEDRKNETPEERLAVTVEKVIWELVAAMKGEYWFHDDIIYSEYDVVKWLKENRFEFYKQALEQPETVEGSDNLTDALKALGLMKEMS